MLTIDKFREAVTAHYAWSRVLAWSPIALGFLAFWATWLVAKFLPAEGYVQSYAQAGSIGALIVFLIIGVGLAASHNDGRSGRDPRLNCPHCECPLQPHLALVIATRNCPNCGRQMLAEPDRD